MLVPPDPAGSGYVRDPGISYKMTHYVSSLWRYVQTMSDISEDFAIWQDTKKLIICSQGKTKPVGPLDINSFRRKCEKNVFFDMSATLKAQMFIICSQCFQLHNDTSWSSLFSFFWSYGSKNMPKSGPRHIFHEIYCVILLANQSTNKWTWVKTKP